MVAAWRSARVPISHRGSRRKYRGIKSGNGGNRNGEESNRRYLGEGGEIGRKSGNRRKAAAVNQRWRRSPRSRRHSRRAISGIAAYIIARKRRRASASAARAWHQRAPPWRLR